MKPDYKIMVVRSFKGPHAAYQADEFREFMIRLTGGRYWISHYLIENTWRVCCCWNSPPP